MLNNNLETVGNLVFGTDGLTWDDALWLVPGFGILKGGQLLARGFKISQATKGASSVGSTVGKAAKTASVASATAASKQTLKAAKIARPTTGADVAMKAVKYTGLGIGTSMAIDHFQSLDNPVDFRDNINLLGLKNYQNWLTAGSLALAATGKKKYVKQAIGLQFLSDIDRGSFNSSEGQNVSQWVKTVLPYAIIPIVGGASSALQRG